MAKRSRSAPSFLRRNGLTIAFLVMMLCTLAGHILAGQKFDNQERAQHGLPPESIAEYVTSGEFLSTLFENWESEFLQMGLFVLLTVGLRQKGSSESRPMDPKDEPKPKPVPKAEQPWPVRRGGIWLRLYEHSLSAALLILFAVSFVAHWYNSWRLHAAEQRQHGERITPLLDYFWDAQFWFESFQNWQSEFLAVIVLGLLSIFLREKDSPQSKDVEARHSDTGAA